ncbi:MAG TPA: hypothetical protein DDW42_05250 [Desulfobacteraceae bacterium]|nr:hypothetical protein [Desulfobacteraceae bacterium]
MAFSSAVTFKTVFGNKRVHRGTFDCASVATGDIDTGLRLCEGIDLTCKGSAVATNAPAINEDLPVDGSAVTIVADSSQGGYWMAMGY